MHFGYALALLLGCGCSAGLGEPAAPLSAPTELCDGWSTEPGCRDPRDAERWLRRPDLEILGSSDAPGGKQDAKVLTVAVTEATGRIVFRAKWRAHSTSHSLNRPHREVNAYALAKLLLDPSERVIPPTAGHCFELASYRARVEPNAYPSFSRISCVFGVLSYWLEDAVSIDDAEDDGLLETSELLDESFFWRSRSYRTSLANVNLLSFLIEHGDSHPKQFVITGSDRAPRVHLVDNTIAFSRYRNPSITASDDWSELRVPALPCSSTARLARLRKSDFEALAVVEQYENRNGLLVPAEPGPPTPARTAGLRWSGNDLQLGLSASEIAALRQRAATVLARVGSGEIPTFE